MTPPLASPARTDSLAAVLNALAAAPHIKPQRRRDVASAIRTATRMLGRPPELIPADPRLLPRRVLEIVPEAASITRKRRNNVRALLRAGIRLTRRMLPVRQLNPLSSKWQALYDRLPNATRRMRLAQPLRYFSGRGIEPDMVTQEHGEAFLKILREETLLKDPENAWREIVYAWNRSGRELPGWPGVIFKFVSRRKKTYGVPWTSFPASLKADIESYLDRLCGIDLADDVPARPIRKATRYLRERQFHAAASALVQRGRDPAGIRSLADLTTLDAYKEGLRFFLARRGGSTSSTIEALACALRTAAKYWVKVDTPTLDAMNAIVHNLMIKRWGMAAKNRERLRPLEDPGIRYALVNLPLRLMRRAESGKLVPKQAALRAQAAVALEILLMAPMRIGNLIHLDVDRNFVRPDRTCGALHIVIPSQEVKNSAELHYPLPEESSALIERYIEQFRPFLASAENRALFPTPGGAKSAKTLTVQITRAVFRFVGIKVNPHLFRHIAAKLHLDQHPGEYEVVTRMLGNRSIGITGAHYTGLETTAAVRYFDEMVLSLRQRNGTP